MVGFDRYEQVLRLLAGEQAEWNIAELAEGLGPAFLEFEHRMRKNDPLIKSGELFLPLLIEQTGVPAAALLARLYNDQVMCVADARSDAFKQRSSYERGRPMPIFKGATSKAVLACLPGRTRNKLLKSLDLESAERTQLDEQLELIRKKGFFIGQGEIDPGVIGIAVPVRHRRSGTYASLSVIVNISDFSDVLRTRLILLLATFAKHIEGFISEAQPEDAADP